MTWTSLRALSMSRYQFHRLVANPFLTMPGIMRNVSASAPNSNDGILPVKKTKINSELTLRTLPPGDDPNARKRPLALFFSWLYASPSALDKYCDLYHRRGMDVLTVACPLKNFLWPNNSQQPAKDLLKYITEDKEYAQRDVVIHAMSIGAFFYTFLLMEMNKESARYQATRDKIKAQVFDSLTLGSLREMATGISLQSRNPIVQKVIQSIILSYFFLTKPYTVKVFDETIDVFKQKPLRTPILLYYGLNDPMSNPAAVSTMTDLWTNEFKLDLTVKGWENSLHAGHLVKHPEEYIGLLNDFLSSSIAGLPERSKL